MGTVKLVEWEYKIELFTNEHALNELGRQGWEAVCPGGKDGNYIVFKRPVAAETTSAPATPSTSTTEPVKKAKKSYREFI